MNHISELFYEYNIYILLNYALDTSKKRELSWNIYLVYDCGIFMDELMSDVKKIKYICNVLLLEVVNLLMNLKTILILFIMEIPIYSEIKWYYKYEWIYCFW